MTGPLGHLPRSCRATLAGTSGYKNRACSSIGSTLALSGRESESCRAGREAPGERDPGHGAFTPMRVCLLRHLRPPRADFALAEERMQVLLAELLFLCDGHEGRSHIRTRSRHD